MVIPVSRFWRLTPLVIFSLTSCQSAQNSAGLGPPPPPPPPPPSAPVASLAITPQSASFAAIDETLDFTAIARDSTQDIVTGVSLTWSSSDQAVITIASTGQARAVGDGTATISVVSGGVSASVPVTVQQVAVSIDVSPTSVSVVVGATASLTATPRDANSHPVGGLMVTWTSSNPGAATVDGAGLVRGVAQGTTTVTAASGSLNRTASVTVTGGTGRTILFQEQFEDANFTARGWYDNGGIQITGSEAHSGSSAAEFHFTPGANVPIGVAMRHLFSDTQSIYLSYWVKYSTSWVGSGDLFHPHEFLFLTNEDSAFEGPAQTFLTVYVEHNYQSGGIPRLAAQDAKNIDLASIGQDLTSVTENRAANGCNGNTDGYSTGCYPAGGGYSNEKVWQAAQPYFLPTPGPGYKNDWHFVEAFIQLNSIQGGIGQTDGVVQYWFDGQLVIDHQDVLLRTGAHPTMAFNQLLVAPYIGSGSPVDQTMWIDELTVATGK